MGFGFTTYYVSIVPGQNLMCSQVWDISWKLGNTAENGGEWCQAGWLFFARIFLYYIHQWSVQSCLFGNITYIQLGAA